MLYVLKLGNGRYIKSVKGIPIQVTSDLGEAHVFRSKSPASYWVNQLSHYFYVLSELEEMNTRGYTGNLEYMKQITRESKELKNVFPDEVIENRLTTQKVGIIELHD